MTLKKLSRLTIGTAFALVFLVACEKVEKLPPGEVETHVVYASKQHAAFPSAVKLANGDILVVFRESRGHVGPDGCIVLCRSTDGGRTWSAPDTIVDTPFDDRDPSIVRTAGGAILLNFFSSRYDEHGKLLGPVGLYISRSFDGGKTWSTPVPISVPGFKWVACSDNILPLPTGRLLLPAYGEPENDSARAAFVLISDDFGATWPRFSIVARDPEAKVDFNEPSLTLLPDNSILCVSRTGRAEHWMAYSRSQDWGETWSTPLFTDVQGEAADLLVTRRSVLVMAYRDFSPMGVSLRFSYDGGRTWEGELPIYTGAGDLAYASLVEVPNNELLVFYYADRAAWRFGYPDKRSVILVSRLRVPYPEKPTGLSASFRDSVTVSLRWNRVPEAHYYKIFRSADPDSLGEEVLMTSESQCLLRVSKEDTAAYYRVVAVQGTNEGLSGYRKESEPSEAVRARR